MDDKPNNLYGERPEIVQRLFRLLEEAKEVVKWKPY
jgi:hypothetical protein